VLGDAATGSVGVRFSIRLQNRDGPYFSHSQSILK